MIFPRDCDFVNTHSYPGTPGAWYNDEVMPRRSSKRRPQDVNVLASSIVEEATREGESAKNPHAVALGRLGGAKGGKARAERLTPEQRRAIARKAALARWSKAP